MKGDARCGCVFTACRCIHEPFGGALRCSPPRAGCRCSFWPALLLHHRGSAPRAWETLDSDFGQLPTSHHGLHLLGHRSWSPSIKHVLCPCQLPEGLWMSLSRTRWPAGRCSTQATTSTPRATEGLVLLKHTTSGSELVPGLREGLP